jgi:transposase
LLDSEDDKQRYGYSRGKRSDCVQVVISLIVTPDGFPLAYEVLPGNAADCTTLRDALRKIEVVENAMLDQRQVQMLADKIAKAKKGQR